MAPRLEETGRPKLVVGLLVSIGTCNISSGVDAEPTDMEPEVVGLA